METNSILEKIKSKYMFQKIFDYIKEENFKFKLFLYSKFFQKKLELGFDNYKEAYISQSKINFNDYLCCYSLFNEKSKNFDKNILNKKLEEDLKKYNLDFNTIKEYLNNYFKKIKEKIDEKEKNKKEKNKKNNQNNNNDNNSTTTNNNDNKNNNKDINSIILCQINIFSPFFDFISKSNFFDIMALPISVKIIEKLNLKNNYIETFEQMNKLNLKYPIITFNYKNSNDINYLKEFKIRFSKIKRLIISHDYSINIEDYDYFFKTLFSFNNIEKNLVYLNLFMGFNKKGRLDSNSLRNINSCSSLETLELKGFKFKTTFIFKLKNLTKLVLKNCENLTFAEDSCLNIKTLYLSDCIIENPESLLKFPELEDCKLQNLMKVKQKYSTIIDFPSLVKIKNITMEISDFINLENTSLTNLTLYSDNNSYEIEKLMFEKIFSISTLKDINLEIREIDDITISEIQGENNCVTNLYIKWLNEYKDCIIDNLQKKFPNLSYINVTTPYKRCKTYLEIKEDPKSKINNFSLKIGGNKNIIFYCQSFENLVSVDFYLNGDIINIINSFPLFNDKCNVTFKSLTHFKFTNYSNQMSIDFLKNIYNNIDKLPILTYFDFHCVSKEVDENFYKEFIREILNLKLGYVNIMIKRDSNESNLKYTDNEIKKMFPDMKFLIFDKINIRKFN